MTTSKTKLLLGGLLVFALSCFGLFVTAVSGERNATLSLLNPQEFPSYHHPPMGITLSYPPDWRLETRDMIPPQPTPEIWTEGFSREGPTEGDLTYANNIVFYAPTFQEHPIDAIYLSIDSVRISPSGDLAAIVDLKIEAARLISPLDATIVTTQTLEGIDAAFVISTTGQLGQSQAICLPKTI